MVSSGQIGSASGAPLPPRAVLLLWAEDLLIVGWLIVGRMLDIVNLGEYEGDSGQDTKTASE